MAEDKKKPARKPVVGSRAPAPAPRKVAGRTTRPEPTEPAGTPTTPPSPTSPPSPPSRPRTQPQTAAPQPSAKPARSGGVLSSVRTTKALVGAIAVLLVAAIALGGTLVFDPFDDSSAAGVDPSDCYDAEKDFEIPDHPVTVPDLDWRAARDESTQAVVKILTVNWKTYDQHLGEAQKLMTRDWAEEHYLNTARDTRANFLKNKADYKFAVVGESVVCASRDEITSLLFLNQYVYKGTGANRVGPDIYQVRVIVTAVREGETWLVDRLDAL